MTLLDRQVTPSDISIEVYKDKDSHYSILITNLRTGQTGIRRDIKNVSLALTLYGKGIRIGFNDQRREK